MIDSGVRQGCIMSPWLFNVYMGAVMKDVNVLKGEAGGMSYHYLVEQL